MKKKIMSVISCAAAMAVSMSVCGAAVPVSAAQKTSSAASSSEKLSDEKALENALSKVKARISIPASYDDFSYTKSTDSARDTYNFEWRETSEISESSEKYISVSISGDIITSFSSFDGSYEEYTNIPSFGRLSEEQLLKAAEKAVSVFDPQTADQIQTDKDSISMYLTSNTVTVRFYRIVNGVKFDKNCGSVTLDKNTGDIVRFNMTWWEDAKFKAVTSAAPKSDIETNYKKRAELVPSYRISEGSDGKNTAVIVYSPAEDMVFDADLAKPTTMYDDYASSRNTDNYSLNSTVEAAVAEETMDFADGGYSVNAKAESGSGQSERVFTDAEKKALIESGKYYSKSDMVDVLKEDKYLGLTEKYVLGYAEFRKNDINGKTNYQWYMNFYVNTENTYKSIDVTADAESGKIVSFSKYSSSEPKKTINIKKVNKQAEEAAKYYLPEIFDEFVPAKENTADADGAKSRTVRFDRTHDNIKVEGNSIRVNVNSDGEIMDFGFTYDDADFESADGMISADEAFDSLFKQKEFELSYDGFLTLDGKARTYLLYSIGTYNISASTGKLCDHYGNELTDTENDSGCPYTDIAGTSSEKYIKKLYDYGVKISGADTEFRPNDAVTEREFADLLDQIAYTGVMYELYGSYSYDSSSKVGNKILTKADSARLFVIAAGGKDFAGLKGIYKSPFRDVSADDDDLGYIALAYALGAAKPDADGNFNPKSRVTRGYAMYLICCYIEAGSRK